MNQTRLPAPDFYGTWHRAFSMNTRQHESAGRNYRLYEALTERAIELRRRQSPRYYQVSRRADMAYAMHLIRIPQYKQTGMHMFIHACNRRT